MSSRLFRSVVAVGMALGTSNGGCLGRSASDGAHQASEARDSEAGKPHEEGTTGEPSPSEVEHEGGEQKHDGVAASSSAGGSQGVGGSGFAASTTGTDSNAERGPAASTGGTAGGMGGATGDSGNTTTSEDSDDPRFDPFCDAAWPTTKGNPDPPSCVDPNQECVDAGYASRCFPLLEDGSCDSLDTQSPFCIDAQWECAPGTVPPSGCRCWGPLPVDQVCTEGGTEQRDQ